MKRLFVVFAAVAAVAAIVAGSAFAGGNGTQVTQFKASYNDMLAGPVSCSGVHQVTKTGAIQESETCKSTTGSPLTYYTPGQVVNFGGGYWMSDLSTYAQIATSGTITVSADGMSYTILANYAS
jgi:hypothetical protein